MAFHGGSKAESILYIHPSSSAYPCKSHGGSWSLFQLPQGKRQGAPRTDRLTEPPVAVIPSVATVVMKTSERKSKYRYICIWWNEIHSVPDASMLLAVLKCCDWWHNVVTHQLHAVVLKLPGKLWYFTIWFWHNIKKTQNFHLSWLVYFPQMWIETLTTVLTLKITSCELEIKYNKAEHTNLYFWPFLFKTCWPHVVMRRTEKRSGFPETVCTVSTFVIL